MGTHRYLPVCVLKRDKGSILFEGKICFGKRNKWKGQIMAEIEIDKQVFLLYNDVCKATTLQALEKIRRKLHEKKILC